MEKGDKDENELFPLKVCPFPSTISLNGSACTATSGFIRVREMSGKFIIFQGQGIVREFHNLSGKIEFLLKCQGNVREF